MSAQCNRVAVTDGHTACLSVKFETTPEREDLIEVWNAFSGYPQEFNLPTAPLKPIHYFHEQNYPQPKLHRNLDKQMAVSIGRLRSCPLFDFKFTVLSHNTMRGAVGAALLNAEIIVQKGLLNLQRINHKFAQEFILSTASKEPVFL